jgi:SAM-dependent methyltransferase
MSCSPIRSSLTPRGASFVATERNAGADLARFYDLDLAGDGDDVQLYVALTGRRGHSILEFGCGTGRIAIPLAEAGHDVVGVDNDTHMLDRARSRWESVGRAGRGQLTLVEADLIAVDLGRRFDFVILGLNTLLMLGSHDAQLAALRVAARNLAPDGHAVIDVWLPTPADLAAYDGALELAWRRRDPETGDEVAKLWSADYDAATGVAEITTLFDSWPAGGGDVTRVARHDVLHLLTARELVMLVERAGMSAQTIGGDYAMTPFGAGSERVVLVSGLL